MLEIKGKVNTAICYAKVIEDDAIEQIRTMCDYGLTEGSKIRIMPDVHAGLGKTMESFYLEVAVSKSESKCCRC